MLQFDKLQEPLLPGDISKSWIDDDTVHVSIVLLCYNQYDYLRDAINSFLAQKTKFCFEIIIHDDNSTDDSKSIINYYVEKYPHIVKAIFQEKNQFSVSRTRPLSNAISYCNGKYIAICEGDDFWITNDKLERQVEFLSNNPSVKLSIHDAFTVGVDDNDSKYKFYLDKFDTGIIPFVEFSKVLTQFSPTASMVCEKTALFSAVSLIDKAPCFDIYIEILLGEKGGFHYINEKMSVYRLETSGSFSSINKKDVIRSLNFQSEVIEQLGKLENHVKATHRYIVKEKIKKLTLNMFYYSSQQNIKISKGYVLSWCRYNAKNRELSLITLKTLLGFIGLKSKVLSKIKRVVLR